MPKTAADKEIEQLKRRRQRAQDNGDVPEEAKLCNAIGEHYSQIGDYRHALHYHRMELSLSEACGDRLGGAIANRKVGECECELGNYGAAIQHQTEHLKTARSLGDEVEEQRALATLGRTYFVQSQSEVEQGQGSGADGSLLQAVNAFLRSLDVSDQLAGTVPEKELLEMRSRLYLNLGLVYETQGNLGRARQFMEKALGTVKELGDSETIFHCHFDLASLHLCEGHATHALRSFQDALSLALGLKNTSFEMECRREMTQAYLELGDFEGCKDSLKQLVRLLEGSQADRQRVSMQLKTVRKVLYYRSQVESLAGDKTEEKMCLYERLGDMCCHLKAYRAAIAFYCKLLSLAEAHGASQRKLSAIYVSLARTHTDCEQFTQALSYYDRELRLCAKNPKEECDTWTNIAVLRERAGLSSQLVMEAYSRAVSLSQQTDSSKLKVATLKAAVRYCSAEAGLQAPGWQEDLALLVEAHPELDGSSSSSQSESELDGGDSDIPESLSSSGEEEEEEGEGEGKGAGHRRSQGVAVRKKSRISRRNEKGETLLHVAAIEGCVATVRRLIREGAEVNSRDNCGWTPLHEACNHGHFEVATALLDGGASVNDGGGGHCGGVTPLIDAAANGHLDIVKLLVERGADPGTKDAEGRTALSLVEGRLQSDGSDRTGEHRDISELLRREMRRRGGGVDGVAPRASRGRDRSGRSVLYTSEEEAPPTIPTHSDVSLTTSSSPLLSGTSTASRHTKGFYNPLGQIELPPLIPDGEEEEEGGEEVMVVDDWLVDDIGQPPAKRKRQKTLESTGMTSLTVRPGGMRRQRRVRTRTRQLNRRRTVAPTAPPTIEIMSDCEGDLPPGPAPSSTYLPQTSESTGPANAPLRIRVKLEGQTYLIPCPPTADGGDTSVGWLARQAAERYYTQQGVRPDLSLTTSDGALLSADDTLAHVLRPNEEVVGVVNRWHHPPVAERYQTACRVCGTAHHHQVVKVLRNSSSTFDLSFLGLSHTHVPPLSRTIVTCHALSSLSLSGNRLRDEGLRSIASALARLPALHRLNLSCTGITALGLDSLASPSLPPETSSTPWPSLRALDLSYNALGQACGRGLSRLLWHCPDLEELSLDSCGLSADMFCLQADLTEVMQALRGLRVLTVSRNPLQGAGLLLLLQSLPQPTRLARLSLAGTCICGDTKEWIQLIAEITGTVQCLDVSYCGLTVTDVPALLETLRACSHLHDLRLFGNDLGQEGVEDIKRRLSTVCVAVCGNPGYEE